MARIHGVGRGVRDLVTLVEQVNSVIWFDNERSAVATASRESGADVNLR